MCENFFLVGNLPFKNFKTLGPKSPNLRRCKGKVEILSIRNLLFEKFAVVCQKIVTFCPAYFFYPRSHRHSHKQLVICVVTGTACLLPWTRLLFRCRYCQICFLLFVDDGSIWNFGGPVALSVTKAGKKFNR